MERKNNNEIKRERKSYTKKGGNGVKWSETFRGRYVKDNRRKVLNDRKFLPFINIRISFRRNCLFSLFLDEIIFN